MFPETLVVLICTLDQSGSCCAKAVSAVAPNDRIAVKNNTVKKNLRMNVLSSSSRAILSLQFDFRARRRFISPPQGRGRARRAADEWANKSAPPGEYRSRQDEREQAPKCAAEADLDTRNSC